MSNDGFADPNPAPIPEDPALVIEGGAMLDMDVEVSCEDCAHYNVCAIFKGFAPMMEDWPQEEEQPVDPSNLALICESFEVDEDE